MKFTVVLDPDPDGGFTASCVEIPGAISEGDTREEALANVADAIAMVLEARREEARRRAESGHRSLTTVEVDA